MVLTNSGSLFSNQGLLDEDGSIKQRWAQHGSELKNIYFVADDDKTVYTVTANKVFYLAAIFSSGGFGDSSTGNIMDGGAGGDVKLRRRSVVF